MPIYKTRELLQQLSQQTENNLQQATPEWQMLPPAVMLHQPEKDKWSAAQCLEHLNSYGLYYLPHIEKAIEKATRNNQKPQNEFKTGWLGGYFTKLMKPDRDTKKVKKMKAPRNHTPPVALNPYKVVGEFIDQQEKLLELLEKAAKIDLEKTKIPISIATFIKLKLGDTLCFLIAHNERHILQAQKALAAVRGYEGKLV